jgi:hypothetical protein
MEYASKLMTKNPKDVNMSQVGLGNTRISRLIDFAQKSPQTLCIPAFDALMAPMPAVGLYNLNPSGWRMVGGS